MSPYVSSELYLLDQMDNRASDPINENLTLLAGDFLRYHPHTGYEVAAFGCNPAIRIAFVGSDG